MEKEKLINFINETPNWSSKIAAKNVKDSTLLEIRDSILSLTSFISSTDTGHYKQRGWHIINDNYEIPKCIICNKSVKWNRLSNKYSEYCSASCGHKSELSKDRRKESNLKKYGTSTPLQNKDILEKVKTTNIERYGSSFTLNNPDVLAKAKKTMLDKYGVENISHYAPIVESRSEKMRDTYNKNLDSIVVKAKNTFIEIEHTDIEIKRFAGSMAEKELFNFVKEYEPDAESNNRSTIKPLELDIFIPSKNIAIEFCGLYWHGEHNKHHTYHYNKYNECKDKGIRLIQIFEDEYSEKEDIIKNKILHLLNQSPSDKIFARKTNVIKVSSKDKGKFFDQYHIQGNGPSSINYGLEYNNELVACIGFIKNSDGSFTLNRYATKHNVIGGFTKLQTHFESLYNRPKVITFADLRWSQGDLYYKSGFIMDKQLEPDYYWVKYDKRYHKFNFRHTSGLKKLANYDPELSESENMHAHGYYRIYDAGKLRFTKN